MKDPEQLRAISDPVERIRAVNAAITDTQSLATELASVSREAVRQMRDQHLSYGQIAKALGISRTRVQQLAD